MDNTQNKTPEPVTVNPQMAAQDAQESDELMDEQLDQMSGGALPKTALRVEAVAQPTQQP